MYILERSDMIDDLTQEGYDRLELNKLTNKDLEKLFNNVFESQSGESYIIDPLSR